MAQRKAGGTAKNLRDSNPKFLGVKIADGQKAKPGAIIVRQRGTKIEAGANVRTGKDHTLYATSQGTVKFRTKRVVRFNGILARKKIVDVIS
jgi:large subunit ribosomal protein L27